MFNPRSGAPVLPDNAPSLSVIIVNVDTAKWLRPCLESLQEQDKSESIEVVVVDNGSSDGSAGMVRQDFPDVKLVRLEETVGFGTANNYGAKHSAAPVILFLNPDTRLGEGSLSQLLPRFAERTDCGIAGGTVFDSKGGLERSKGSFPTLFSMGLGRLLKYLPPLRPLLGRFSHQHWVGYDKPRRVDWVTGAYLWIRREVFERVGGFDPRIFMYCEDVDLCYRVRQLGFEVRFYPEAPIIHYGGKSRAPRPRKKMLYESLCYFSDKHYESPRYWMTRFVFRIMSKR